MGRLKNSKNINSSLAPATLSMTTEQRILFLANLIIDRIIDDQNKGRTPWKH